MPNYNLAVEELLREKGEKKGSYFVGDLTTKEILDRLDISLNQVNHRRVLHTIRAFYPQSSFEEFSGEVGYVIHVRIRTK